MIDSIPFSRRRQRPYSNSIPSSDSEDLDLSGSLEISPSHHQVEVRSFLRRSASVCSLSDRFSYRREALVHESRRNPYIGYFIRHDKSLRARRSSARFIRPIPAIKTTCLSATSALTTASPTPCGTPSGKRKGVTFSNTVRRSSVVMTDWKHVRPLRPRRSIFDLILESSTSVVSHGVVL